MSSRKRRRVAQNKIEVAAPLLPPPVADVEVDVSDEDLDFVAKYRKYAGFLSSLDASSITREVLGIKSSNRWDDNLESYYEKRGKLFPKSKADDTNLVDRAVVLPVKTLSGELHYLSAKPKAQQEKEEEATLNFEERKAFVGRKTPVSTTQPDSLPGQNIEFIRLAKRGRTIAELEKDQKKAKRDEFSNRETHTAKASSQLSALEELKNDLTEHKRIEETMAKIAELGTSVLADPEKHLDSLTDLQGYCSNSDANISWMAMLSLLAVFKDIVPGYRIRLRTQKELEMPVSKEVKKLRDFDTNLLKSYQRYVQCLVTSIKGPLWKAATRCVTGLLEVIPHFNFRSSLLSFVISLMNSDDRDCRKMSCDAVKSLFLNEGKHGGLATVEAVEMIADFVKNEECILRPDAIQVFLSLSFNEDLNKPCLNQRKKNRSEAGVERPDFKTEEQGKIAKKYRLAAKLRKEVAADFREANAMPEASELQRMQTQTLTAVFETYFRILKASLHPVKSVPVSKSASIKAKVAKYGPRPLLAFCLDGLAKFSHLVSVEFMTDLLTLLKRLAGGTVPSLGVHLEDMKLLSFTERLHCCIVAFKIVQSNLNALNIDLRDFYVSLYNLLPLHKLIRNEQDGLIFAETLQVMLWESRQHDMQRVAAFIKRLAAHSLHFGPAEAISALVTVRQLLQRYRTCCSLLENDDGGLSGDLVNLHGEDTADPDLSGALSSILWELTVLSRHYHPAVSMLANQISNMLGLHEASQASLTPKEALVLYSTSKGGFNPSVQMPKCKVRRKCYAKQSVNAFKSDSDMGYGSLDTERSEMFGSYFKVLQKSRENEALRTEPRKLICNVDLLKAFQDCKKR